MQHALCYLGARSRSPGVFKFNVNYKCEDFVFEIRGMSLFVVVFSGVGYIHAFELYTYEQTLIT